MSSIWNSMYNLLIGLMKKGNCTGETGVSLSVPVSHDSGMFQEHVLLKLNEFFNVINIKFLIYPFPPPKKGLKSK